MADHDESWKNLREAHERLSWSRNRWQAALGISPSKEAAAESLGMKAGTYRAYERPTTASKHTALDHQSAIRFAKKFKVNWIWLLTGDGTPDTPDLTPAQERILRATTGASKDDQERVANAVEALMKRGAA